jgi:hypothetical protein
VGITGPFVVVARETLRGVLLLTVNVADNGDRAGIQDFKVPEPCFKAKIRALNLASYKALVKSPNSVYDLAPSQKKLSGQPLGIGNVVKLITASSNIAAGYGKLIAVKKRVSAVDVAFATQDFWTNDIGLLLMHGSQYTVENPGVFDMNVLVE